MLNQNLYDYMYILVFSLTSVVLIALLLLLSKLFRPFRPAGDKLIPYESGNVPIGDAWARFNIRYFLIALVFVAFDVEAAFLFPLAVVFRKSKELLSLAFAEMLVFIAIFVVALVYAWKKGALEWVL